MGILESNKRDGRSNKNSVITSRLTAEEYKKFKDICDATGYSIAEAVRLLIISELNPKQRSAPSYTPVQKAKVDAPAVISTEPEVARKPEVKRISSGGFAKFTTERWKVDEALPCPICNEWHSATNFSRHAKKAHALSTKDIFTTHAEAADKMVKDIKDSH